MDEQTPSDSIFYDLETMDFDFVQLELNFDYSSLEGEFEQIEMEDFILDDLMSDVTKMKSHENLRKQN